MTAFHERIAPAAGHDDRLVTLDAMRGLAALAVAAGHLGLLGPHPVYGVAVDFFFMLSGFVLLRTYDGRLTDAHSVRHYLARRAIRLVPLFVVGLGLGAIAFAAGVHPEPAAKPLRDSMLVAWDPPGWSLAYEAVASVAIGVGIWRRWGRIETGLLCLGVAGICVSTLHNGSPSGGWSIGQVHYGVTRMLFGFSAGALAYRCAAAPRWPWWGVVVPFVLALLSPWYGVAAQIVLALGVFPLLLWLGARATPMPFGRALGELSYPLYILHMPLYWMLEPWPPLLRLAVAIVVSVILLKLFDQPLRDRLLAWERRSVATGAGDRRRPAIALGR